MKTRAIITDVDNTLYNFVDYYAPAFRAMIHVLSRESKVSEERLVLACREVYAKARSLEYPGLVQHLTNYLPEFSRINVEELTHLASVAFQTSRRLRLRLYPGVKETLDWLKNHGYIIVAYTDGPYKYNREKFRWLGLQKYLDGVVAWGPTPEEISSDGLYLDTTIPLRWFLETTEPVAAGPYLLVPHERRKPNIDVLRQLLKHFSLDSNETWVVGDSLEKDIRPAEELGLKAVWARYGKNYDALNWETLVKVSPWQGTVIASEATQRTRETPALQIDAFAELQSLVPALQLGLF